MDCLDEDQDQRVLVDQPGLLVAQIEKFDVAAVLRDVGQGTISVIELCQIDGIGKFILDLIQDVFQTDRIVKRDDTVLQVDNFCVTFHISYLTDTDPGFPPGSDFS